MKYFDLHCDTLYRLYEENQNFNDVNFHINSKKIKSFEKYTQCFAIWMTNGIKNQNSDILFKRCVDIFNKQIKPLASDNFTPILTIEDIGFLGLDINKIKLLKDCNVKMASLTWNKENEIGGGNGDEMPLSKFGKAAVKEMENQGIIIDVSHASDALFFSVAEETKSPIVASHSNARAVCKSKRNLTNEQLKIIKERNGLVGLNFSVKFLNDDIKKSSTYDIIRHAEHILSLGLEDNLCMGSDFDGTDLPEEINSLEKIEFLYELFLKHNYNETLLEKLFYSNASDFFGKYI